VHLNSKKKKIEPTLTSNSFFRIHLKKSFKKVLTVERSFLELINLKMFCIRRIRNWINGILYCIFWKR